MTNHPAGFGQWLHNLGISVKAGLLVMLFAQSRVAGIATPNIAVAQAYITMSLNRKISPKAWA